MEMRSKQSFLIFSMSFIVSFSAMAQEENKQSLSTIFTTIQKQFNIQFNYAEDVISDIKINVPPKGLDLNEVINYLEQETNLVFTRSGESFVIVSTIEAFSQLQRLSEVVISGYLVKGINKLKNGSIQADFSNFDILPGLLNTDVLQTIQAFPGVLSINETVSNINIRGGTHDQNLMLWDDIKMYQSGHFFGLISVFNPQMTQHVNLLKNGSSVAFTDGVSGTIAMSGNESVNTKFKGSVGGNFIDANGYVDVPISKKSSIQIAARKSISDFIQTPMYKNYFERISQDTEVETNANSIVNSDKAFDFYDVSFRWVYKLSDKDKIRLSFINIGNELLFDENGLQNGLLTTRQSSLSQNSVAAGLTYERSWNDKWQSVFEAYETDYRLKAVNENIVDSQRFLQENKVSETSLKLKVNHNISNQLNWMFGYHFVETEITNLDDVDNPVFRFLVSEVVRTNGVFSQLNFISTNRKTNLTGGVRYTYIDKFQKQLIEPRLSLSHKFLTDFTFEVLGEMKHQNTSQIINFQNDFLGIEKRRWQLSNDKDIPIIKSKQVSAGLSYNRKGWLISAEAYYKNVSGITSQSQGFQTKYEFIKTSGEYDITGVDVLFRKGFKKLTTWLSYSFMNNDYIFNELPETSFPSNYDITNAVTFGTAYTTGNFKVSAGLNWHSGKPTTNPITENDIINGEINFEPINSSNLKEYMRVDLSAMYDYSFTEKATVKFGISVWNVLDAENKINSFYRIIDGTVVETAQNSLGITPNAFIRVAF